MWLWLVERPLHSPYILVGSLVVSFAYTFAVTFYGARKDDRPPNKNVKSIIVPLHNFILIVWSLGMHLALWKCILDRKTWHSIACEPTLSSSFEPRSQFEDVTLLVKLSLDIRCFMSCRCSYCQNTTNCLTRPSTTRSSMKSASSTHFTMRSVCCRESREYDLRWCWLPQPRGTWRRSAWCFMGPSSTRECT